MVWPVERPEVFGDMQDHRVHLEAIVGSLSIPLNDGPSKHRDGLATRESWMVLTNYRHAHDNPGAGSRRGVIIGRGLCARAHRSRRKRLPTRSPMLTSIERVHRFPPHGRWSGKGIIGTRTKVARTRKLESSRHPRSEGSYFRVLLWPTAQVPCLDEISALSAFNGQLADKGQLLSWPNIYTVVCWRGRPRGGAKGRPRGRPRGGSTVMSTGRRSDGRNTRFGGGGQPPSAESVPRS